MRLSKWFEMLLSDTVKSKNIRLGYWLTALQSAFFWYAPWLLFVYRYIDIKQATILAMIGMITQTITEVPTGAIADLLGKKKTLILSFLISGIAEVLAGFSNSFIDFVFTFTLISIGYSFFSGTYDAFMYDSLVEEKKSDLYPEVLSKSVAFTSLATAVATLVGGFLFQFWGGLPFVLTGLAKFIALIVVLKATEPKVDTFVFSLRNFVRQNVSGFKHLFSKKMFLDTLLLVLLGGFGTIAYEILDDVAVVDWGYNAVGISWLYTTALIIGIPFGLFYKKIAAKTKPIYLVSVGVLFFVLNYIFSPLINIYIWTGLFLLRVMFSPIRSAAVKDVINKDVASNIRATTLSTYQLVIKIPYAVLGVVIGTSMKNNGVKYFSFQYASLFLLLLLAYWVYRVVAEKKMDEAKV